MSDFDNILCILLLIFIVLYLIYKKNNFCRKEHYYNMEQPKQKICQSHIGEYNI